MHRRFTLPALVIALTALSALFVACDGRNAYVPPPPPKVTVAKPVRQPVQNYKECSGNTQSVKSVNLSARVEGYLQALSFTDGQHVKKDQLLFTIEPAPYLAKLNQAKADVMSQKARLTQAETELARSKKLFAERAGPDTEVVKWQRERDSASADLDVAKANQQIAEINYSYTHVTAPFDGRISRRQVDPGNLVGAGGATTLATLISEDPIYVYFTLSERDVLDISEGTRRNAASDPESTVKKGHKPVILEMGLSNKTDFPYKGQLDYYDLGIDPQTGTILMRGVFPNPDGDLLSGYFVRLRASMGVRDVLTVPEGAVGVAQVGHYVLVVDDKNTVQQKPVTVGAAVNGLRVIEKGLEGTERVVVNGLQRARPGAPVTPEEAKP